MEQFYYTVCREGNSVSGEGGFQVRAASAGLDQPRCMELLTYCRYQQYFDARASGFLDRIKQAYARDANLKNLLVDPDFAKDLAERQAAWRRVVGLAVSAGIGVPGMTASLGYFDTYRRGRGTANLVQAQRDFFGSHTYERVDKEGWFHTVWDESFGSKDSITTSGYNQ